MVDKFMPEFIICDDDKAITEKIDRTVTDVMMNNKLDYKTLIFHDYNDEFILLINNREYMFWI